MRDIITPEPGEHVAWLIAQGHVDEAAALQAYQVSIGRLAALEGQPFNMGQTAAWQTGYAEALGDTERGPYARHWSDRHCR